MEREEAARLGYTRYNTGRPCKHGHRPDRYTVSGICVECQAIAAKKSRGEYAAIRNSGRAGLLDLSGVLIHPDDLDAVEALVNACRLMRGLGPSPKPRALAPAARRATAEEIDANRADVLKRINASEAPPSRDGPSFLASGAPAAKPQAVSLYVTRLLDFQDAYMRTLSADARERLAHALRHYGEEGQHLPTPADEEQVQAVLALVDRYVTEFTAESLAAMRAAFDRGPLPRAVNSGPLRDWSQL